MVKDPAAMRAKPSLHSPTARLAIVATLIGATIAGLEMGGAHLLAASVSRDFVRFVLPTLVICGCFLSAALLPRDARETFAYRVALPLAGGLAAVVLLHERGRIFDPRRLLDFAWLVPYGFLVWKFRGSFGKDASGSRVGRLTPLVVLTGVLFLALLTNENTFRSAGWFYFLEWWPRETAGRFGSGLARLAVVTAVLTPLFLTGRRRPGLAAGAAALFSVTACLLCKQPSR